MRRVQLSPITCINSQFSPKYWFVRAKLGHVPCHMCDVKHRRNPLLWQDIMLSD
jgi:hypothetical protein